MSDFFPSDLFDVVVPSTGLAPCDDDELARLISDVDFLVVRRYYQITGKIMKEAKRLKLIQRAGTLCGNIDIETARKEGIFVSNMLMALDASVAELTLLLMLALSKKLIRAHRSVIDGEYKSRGLEPVECDEHEALSRWMELPIQCLFEKTLGVVGLGEIGRLVVERAKSFGMNVLYNKRRRLDKNEEKELGAEYRDFQALFREADFVTLHIPLTEQSRRLIGRKELSLMKPDSFIINTSRGGVIDESALYEALKNHEIGGAGLDVFEKEPVPKDNPLLALDNVVFTPHIHHGGLNILSHDLQKIRSNIMRMVGGEIPLNVVNNLDRCR